MATVSALVSAEARFAPDGVARNVATPVPKPETPVLIGSPVAFVRTTADGVPRAGVVIEQLVVKHTLPVPLAATCVSVTVPEEFVPR